MLHRRWSCYSWERRRCLSAGAERGASKSFSVLILLNLVSLAVSTALSTRPGLSLIGTNWREFGLVPQAAALLFAWSVAGCPGNARVVLRGVAISGAAAGAYGIAQYFGWDPFLPAAAYHIGEGIWTIVRPPGTLGYVSYFATWLVVSAFLSLALETMENGIGMAMDGARGGGDLRDCDGVDGNARGHVGFGGGRSGVALFARVSHNAANGGGRRGGGVARRGVLFFAGRLESSQPHALVRRRSLGRRARTSVARHIADGIAPPGGGIRSRSLYRGVCAIRIA